MRLPAAILILVLCTSAQQTAQTPVGLEGTVLDARTGKPIAGARVNPIPFNANGTFTNDKGAFSLGPLAPGRFQLLVDAPGHVGQTVVIDLAIGERRNGVEIRLEQTGVISGRVVDSAGRPIAGIYPQTMVYTHSFPGSNSSVIARADQSDVTLHPLELGRSGGTDDRGEFRIYNLPPGEYFLRIARRSNPSSGAVLYPGVVGPSKAVPIRVRAGEDVRLADVTLASPNLGLITAYITNTNREALRPNDGYGLDLLSSTGTFIDSIGGSAPLSIRPDAPGPYVVCASLTIAATASRSCRSVEYTGAEMNLDFTVTKPDGKFTGRILLEQQDGTLAMPLQGASVLLDIQKANGMAAFATGKSDGNFEETGLYRGRGQVTSLVRRPGQGNPNYYLASVRQGDRDVLTDGLIITDQESNVEILVSALGGVVRGKITDADGHIVPNATVAIVPEGDLVKRTDLNDIYRTDQSDIDGIFEIRGVIPGSYRAFAATRPENWAYWDSEYMKQFDSVGKSIQIVKGGSASADLTAIIIDIETTK